NSPDTQLNAVVLPAPLGPISETISPWPMSKLTSLTAMSPPKRLVRLSSSSSAMSGLALNGGQRLGLDACLQLYSPSAAGQQAAGAEQHHADQGDAVDHVRVLVEVDIAELREV